jgi:hypothetical protein
MGVQLLQPAASGSGSVLEVGSRRDCALVSNGLAAKVGPPFGSADGHSEPLQADDQGRSLTPSVLP